MLSQIEIDNPMQLEFLKTKNKFCLTDDSGEKTFSSSLRFAARYREYADQDTKKYLNRRLITVSPFSGDLGRGSLSTLTPEQRRALRFCLSRNHSYLALDPGMGKSRVAIEALNFLDSTCAEIVCPPHAVDVWVSEIHKWLGRDFKVTKSPHRIDVTTEQGQLIRIISDTKASPKYWAGTKRPDTIIVDESHRFKARSDAGCSARARNLFGRESLINGVPTVILLSGTPMPNRPAELYPILKKLAPEVIDDMSFHEYGLRYCKAFRDARGKWHYKGASNTDELFDRMREVFMLRLRKNEETMRSKVREEVRIIGEDLRGEVGDLDRAFLKKHSPDGPDDIPREKMSRYFRLLGDEKIRPAVRLIAWDDLLRGPDDGKAIVFAHHKNVVKSLAIRLSRWTNSFVPVIDGDTPKKNKTQSIRRFQFDKSVRVIVLNIAAGGTATTLTAGNRVYMVEFDWSPETNRQARDRAHRLGQERDVTVQYLVFKNSLDRVKLEENLRKQKLIDAL